MVNTGKISPLIKDYSGQDTMAAALAKIGRASFPKAKRMYQPYREKNGKYRTGLDPEAIYIKSIEKRDPEAAAQERAKVTGLLERALELTGFTKQDLSPDAPFYTQMMDGEFGKQTRASMLSLMDRTREFNLENGYDLITYAWARVHPDIAPSQRAYTNGGLWLDAPMLSEIYYFVDDEEYKIDQEYNEKAELNKAAHSLQEMSPSKMVKVARLLGIKAAENSRPEKLYLLLDKYIKEKDKKNSDPLVRVKLFNNICSLAEEHLDIRYTLHEALYFSVLREAKGGSIYDGTTLMFKDKNEGIEYLSNPKHQEELLSLKERVRSARINIEV